jgi:hypothetical protein
MHEQITTAARPDDAQWVSWNLDALEGEALRTAYRDVASFVAWLRACDIEVPACWYTHPWVVWRLAALSAWLEVAYLADANPREAVDWWLVGLEPLRRDWADLQAHRGRHVPPEAPLDDPAPVAPLDDVIDSVVARRASEGRA